MISQGELQEEDFIGKRVGPYTCVELIGKGGFATIYKAISESDRLIVALKVINKRKILAEHNMAVRRIKQKLIRSEAEIMSKCESKHVVRLYGRYETDDYIMLALEYCNGGDLAMQIDNRGKIPENEAVLIIKQIVLGFADLHRLNVVHRDLKSTNIFRHNENYKIGDLGFAVIIESMQENTLSTVIGSYSTMAPEVLNELPYGTKADIWSLGVVYYQMLFGKVPQLGALLGKLGDRVELDLSSLSPASKEFLERTLVPNPELRISWSQLYNLPLFRSRSNVSPNMGYQVKQRHEENVDLKGSFIIHQQIEENERQRKLLPRNIAREVDEMEGKAQVPFSEVQVENRHSSVENLRVVTSHRENVDREIYHYIDLLNFQMQKVLLLLSELVEPLTRKATGLPKQREAVELAYLICKKCMTIMSPITDALNHKVNKYEWIYYKEFLESTLSKSFLNEFRNAYNFTVAKLEVLNKQLYELEEKNIEKMFDFFKKRLQQEEYKLKDGIINGIEGHDYTQQQYLKFVEEKYIGPLRKEMEDILDQMHHNIPRRDTINRLRCYLLCYRKFVEAEYDPKENVLMKIFDATRKYLGVRL